MNSDPVLAQMEELWHNLYRMHSYVEAAFNVQDGERPPLLQRADLLLKASYARVKHVMPDNIACAIEMACNDPEEKYERRKT